MNLILKVINYMYNSHEDVEKFAENVVNLPSVHADRYRNNIKDLSNHIEEHITENPRSRLKRMMLFGGLANHTSLRSIMIQDIALYVKLDDTPQDMEDSLNRIADDLATIYPHIGRKNIEPKTYSVSIALDNFDVNVVPIFWINEQWDGELVSQTDGRYIRTNIPQHIEFMNKRPQSHQAGFRQVIRFIKYWAERQQQANENFRFQGYMIELIVAHLVDKNILTLNNYPEALRQFFDYLIVSGLNDSIFFNDFIIASVKKQNKPINIFDPANLANNVASEYTEEHKTLILEAAMEAADAIEYVACAIKKDIVLHQWRKVFGHSYIV